MKNKRKLIVLISIIVFFILVIFVNIKRTNVVKVEVVKVSRGKIEEIVSAPGEIHSEEERQINAEVTAEVIKLYVEEGDKVKEGQVLVKLDSTEQYAAYRRALAGLNAQRADLEFKKEQLRRKKELYEKGLISKENYENIATEVELAESNFENAIAELKRAKRMLERATIRAPIKGTIMNINKREGEVVVAGTVNNPGSIILTISDLEKMEMVAKVNENEVPRVSIGDTARISIDAFPDTTFIGIVYYKASMPKETSLGVVEFEVKISIPFHPGMLPGMSANCEIITAKKQNVLRIPLQALVTKEEKSGVYKIENGVVKFVEIKTGIIEGKWVEVKEGLLENDLVVSGPLKTMINLVDNQKVSWEESERKDKKIEKNDK
ncbi:MAG: efflux RND transporter periplasmic adaptor subunit [candidate division WOR-3 bacterium]